MMKKLHILNIYTYTDRVLKSKFSQLNSSRYQVKNFLFLATISISKSLFQLEIFTKSLDFKFEKEQNRMEYMISKQEFNRYL